MQVTGRDTVICRGNTSFKVDSFLFLQEEENAGPSASVLPDGIFSNQKKQFG
jgi:hypothetical protein